MQYCNAYVMYQGRRARARGCKWMSLPLRGCDMTQVRDCGVTQVRDCGVTQDSECERDAV